MGHLSLIVLMVSSLLIKPSQAQDSTQSFTLTVADIDHMRCPSRDSVLARIWSQIQFDPVLRRDHIRQTLIAYVRLNAFQQELAILRKQRTNLSRLYRLYLEKQKHGEASDEEVLRAEHDLLNKDLAIVNSSYQIQETVISITTWANIPIDLTPPQRDVDKTRVMAEAPPPGRLKKELATAGDKDHLEETIRALAKRVNISSNLGPPEGGVNEKKVIAEAPTPDRVNKEPVTAGDQDKSKKAEENFLNWRDEEAYLHWRGGAKKSRVMAEAPTLDRENKELATADSSNRFERAISEFARLFRIRKHRTPPEGEAGEANEKKVITEVPHPNRKRGAVRQRR